MLLAGTVFTAPYVRIYNIPGFTIVQSNDIVSDFNILSLSTPIAYISNLKVSPIDVVLASSKNILTESTVN